MSDDLKAVKVRVTREKLATGEPAKCGECPVVLAIDDHLKPPFEARIYHCYKFVIVEKVFGVAYERHEGELPRRVIRRINRIDRLAPVIPFKFTLAIPAQFLKDTPDAHP